MIKKIGENKKYTILTLEVQKMETLTLIRYLILAAILIPIIFPRINPTYVNNKLHTEKIHAASWSTQSGAVPSNNLSICDGLPEKRPSLWGKANS